MSQSDKLREIRNGTIVNDRSKIQESTLSEIIDMIHNDLHTQYNLTIMYAKKISLSSIIQILKQYEPEQEYANVKNTSSMMPDGGMTYLMDKDGNKYPILIAEVKTQGTNDKRAVEGKTKQAQGNAIERLGKNVLGIDAMMGHEDITPFVCFGQGCDFADGSSILDRVHTIARFRPINRIDMGSRSVGSFFFREEKWSAQEQYDIMIDIANNAIKYYKGKYGDIFI